MVGGDVLAAVVALGEELHERLAVGDDREDVLEARDRVADADLDRARAVDAA